MLSVRGLTKTFGSESGNVQAVRGIDFDVARGEFYTLLGPSGCGKTTTLRCIAGLEKPDEGEIAMADQVVFSSARGIVVSADRRDLGMVYRTPSDPFVANFVGKTNLVPGKVVESQGASGVVETPLGRFIYAMQGAARVGIPGLARCRRASPELIARHGGVPDLRRRRH